MNQIEIEKLKELLLKKQIEVENVLKGFSVSDCKLILESVVKTLESSSYFSPKN
jgi:hypothetical protein